VDFINFSLNKLATLMGDIMDFKGLFGKLILLILVIVVLFGGYMIMSSMNKGNPANPSPGVVISTVTPTPTPIVIEKPKFEIVSITVSKCTDCFDVDAFASFLETQFDSEVKNTKYEYNTSEAKVLIGKYNITKGPTLLIKGDINKVPELEAFLAKAAKEFQGTYLIRDVAPPYWDFGADKIAGLVSFTLIYDENCKKCENASVPINSAKVDLRKLATTMNEIPEISMGIAEDIAIEANSDAGKKLVQSYNITRLPAYVLSKDIAEYPEIFEALKKIGTIEGDGKLVLRDLNPPYYDLVAKKESGDVKLVYINSGKLCSPDCYNYTFHEAAIAKFGVLIAGITDYSYDSKEGKELIGKYNVTKIPTVLISPEVKEFKSFTSVSDQIGGFAKDGWFVFNKFENIQGSYYYDIPTNKTLQA
jgi:hypothetical protein